MHVQMKTTNTIPSKHAIKIDSCHLQLTDLASFHHGTKRVKRTSCISDYLVFHFFHKWSLVKLKSSLTEFTIKVENSLTIWLCQIIFTKSCSPQSKQNLSPICFPLSCEYVRYCRLEKTQALKDELYVPHFTLHCFKHYFNDLDHITHSFRLNEGLATPFLKFPRKQQLE